MSGSEEDDIIVPHVLRRSRRNRLGDPLEENAEGTIDLTRDSVTPVNLNDTDLADIDTDGPSGGKGGKGHTRSKKRKNAWNRS